MIYQKLIKSFYLLHPSHKNYYKKYAMDDLVTPTKNITQPVTESFFLTPTAGNICILCHEDITVKFPKVC